MANSRLKQEIYKMSLEHFVVQERKVLETKQRTQKPILGASQRTQETAKREVPMTKAGTIRTKIK